MGILNLWFPKEKKFYGMLAEQSQLTLNGITIFADIMASGVKPEGVRRIVDAEHEADKKRRILIDDLNRTFITPIEREDIFSLSRAIDDIIDLAKSAVEEFQIYKLAATSDINAMLGKVQEGVGLLNESIAFLKEHPSIAVEKASKAKDMIDDLEILYYQALARLCEGDDVKFMFKMREIYKHIYNLSSKVDKAANIILDIIVKTT
jgi:uncharacterized protein